MVKKLLLMLLFIGATVQACQLGECVADCKQFAGQDKQDCREKCLDQYGDTTEHMH